MSGFASTTGYNIREGAAMLAARIATRPYDVTLEHENTGRRAVYTVEAEDSTEAVNLAMVAGWRLVGVVRTPIGGPGWSVRA